jgi:hypothetical protein
MPPFDAAQLPDPEKERLCRALLAEFGANTITQINTKGEMIHSCILPFGLHPHGDRSASASLNYKKLTYNCFVCGGGGLLWLIGTCRGTNAGDAQRWLQTEEGIGGVQDLSSLLGYFDALYEPRMRPPPMPKLAESVLTPWMFIHPYMTEIRHIPVETLAHFKVGYGRFEYEGGIVSERIVIPHFFEGKLVGWQTRRLDPNDGTPKYKSSPDLPKDRTLFNYQRHASQALVVESPMSVLSKHHWGATSTPIEATFGASVTQKQVMLLTKHRNVTLFFDNDQAGWNATRVVGEMLLPYCSVWVANNPWAADPADLNDNDFLHVLREAVPFSLWEKPDRLASYDDQQSVGVQ